MSYDPMTSVSAVKSMAAALAGLGTELSDAAPSGGFASVLAKINTEMTSLADGGRLPTSAPSTPTATGGDSLGTTGGAGTGGPAGGSGVTAASFGSVMAGPMVYAPLGPSAPLGPTTVGYSVAGPSASAPTGTAIVADAEKYLGVPYQWGGTDPATGLDCSGLVQHVYGDFGINLPRTSQEQATVGTPVADVASARPGDLVFYEPSASGPGHVGIYIGNGKMINAPHTGTVVSITDVGTPSAIRRILPDAAATGPAGAFSLAAGPPAAAASAAMNALGAPPALQTLFAQAGARYGVDPTLLAAVARQESGYQTDAVSGAGAQGLMQLMPATAAGLGVSPFDPASAIDGAAQLLSGYLRNYNGSVPMALAAYNAGPGAVNAYGGVPPYGETQQYVASITSMLASAQQAQVAA